MMLRSARLVLAALSVVLVAASCDQPAPLAPDAPPAASPRRDLLGTTLDPITSQLHLLSCPTDQTVSATAVVGPEGGSLAAGGFRVDFPAGAVESPQTFELTVPAGESLQIEVHAQGYDHYWFDTPVVVTLDLSRCGLLPSGLQVWNDDPQTQMLLEPMGGVLSVLTRTMTFSTPHFSGYTIAW